MIRGRGNTAEGCCRKTNTVTLLVRKNLLCGRSGLHQSTSPDSFAGGYNSIAFLKDGVAFDFITGSSVTGCCGGNVANSQVTVTASSAFNSFEMRSSRAAFEYANLQVAAVPLPAGGLLLIGAMGGLAALRRRKAAAAA